ncbi:hypothetical protein HHI36_011098 [Cryptolaemus montrouzieri]|uniref:Uncharacterized protein n=1 Tax=Cryptolaemus montrouzieri TaxID=559131 RepID=A0ABD2MKR0_9CUCU
MFLGFLRKLGNPSCHMKSILILIQYEDDIKRTKRIHHKQWKTSFPDENISELILLLELECALKSKKLLKAEMECSQNSAYIYRKTAYDCVCLLTIICLFQVIFLYISGKDFENSNSYPPISLLSISPKIYIKD